MHLLVFNCTILKRIIPIDYAGKTEILTERSRKNPVRFHGRDLSSVRYYTIAAVMMAIL